MADLADGHRDTVLGDQQIVTAKGDARVVRIVDVIETDVASRNGYLSLRPTAQAFRSRVPSGGDTDD